MARRLDGSRSSFTARQRSLCRVVAVVVSVKVRRRGEEEEADEKCVREEDREEEEYGQRGENKVEV